MGCVKHVIERCEDAAFHHEFGPTSSPEEGFAKRTKTWFNGDDKKTCQNVLILRKIKLSIIRGNIESIVLFFKLNTIPIPKSEKLDQMKADTVSVLQDVLENKDTLRGDYTTLALTTLVMLPS